MQANCPCNDAGKNAAVEKSHSCPDKMDKRTVLDAWDTKQIQDKTAGQHNPKRSAGWYPFDPQSGLNWGMLHMLTEKNKKGRLY